MSTLIPGKDRLDGWKAISDHLGWHVRTVMRWEQHRGLPIHRVPGGQRHAVFAFRQELDDWLKDGHFGNKELFETPEYLPNGIPFPHSTSAIPETETTSPIATTASSQSSPHIRGRINRRMVIWIAVCFVSVLLGGFALRSLMFPATVHFTDVVQLTNDGAYKDGLVTDGRTLYFGERQQSRIVLASLSVEGGPIRTIPTPFVQAAPTDLSLNGAKLLAFVWEGIESERALWIVPVAGGLPQKVGDVRCHAAAWSPDGRRIAFAAQNAIYLTDDNGTSIQQIQAFSETPEFLAWSPDGLRLRFSLRKKTSPTFSIWELSFSDQAATQVTSLVPLHVEIRNFSANSMTFDASGGSFLAGGDSENERIYFLRKFIEPWSSRFDTLATNAKVRHVYSLALDYASRRVFAIAGSAGLQKSMETERSDLLLFNVKSGEFRPFFPGIFARDLDFSRDGKSIAYVRAPDQSLWISRSDGSGARQIPFSATYLELPRWSADGKWLAFMAQLPDQPWHIFIVPVGGGKPREASAGTDNQGAPTWSPDGKWIVYGNVECQEEDTCAIHKLELATGRTYTIPGSEGLGTARWSPNGRFIGAINPVLHEIQVFDVTTETWRKLADGINGNDLSWSPDSQYLYASRPAGDQPEILRVSLQNAKLETVVDLRSFTAETGHINTWFALAPDGSIIFLREINGNEIYSLSYSER